MSRGGVGYMRNKDEIFEEIEKLQLTGRVERDVNMSEQTSFRIGGPAELYFLPDSTHEIIAMAGFCKKNKVPLLVIGHGTNLLVDDGGIQGMVMKVGGQLGGMRLEGTRLIAEAGASISEAAKFARAHGLTGMEFAYGIPGTVGGAVYMNAGAYGSEISAVVSRTVFLDELLNVGIIDRDSHMFAYRFSCFQHTGKIILEVEFNLKVGDPQTIQETMDDYLNRRKSSQPLDMPSAGSVFRRPEGQFVGPMIEQCGLKGFKIGNAQVSEKHAGFIVNTGGAKASDVRALIEHIRNCVNKQFAVQLETEIRLVGKVDPVKTGNRKPDAIKPTKGKPDAIKPVKKEHDSEKPNNKGKSDKESRAKK